MGEIEDGDESDKVDIQLGDPGNVQTEDMDDNTAKDDAKADVDGFVGGHEEEEQADSRPIRESRVTDLTLLRTSPLDLRLRNPRVRDER